MLQAGEAGALFSSTPEMSQTASDRVFGDGKRRIALDTETYPISPGNPTPRIVCLSACDGDSAGLWLRDEGLANLRAWLQDPEVILVGFNLPYDLSCACADDPYLLPLVFAAIEQNRIVDIQLNDAVIDNAEGRLKFEWDAAKQKWVTNSRNNLANSVYRWLRRKLPKDDAVRLTYGNLDDIPIEKWPEAHRTYAIGDAVHPWDVYAKQYQTEGIRERLVDSARHMSHAWALQLCSVRGFRTDREYTLKLEKSLLEELAVYRDIAHQYGFVRPDTEKGPGAKSEKAARAALSRLIPNPTRTPPSDKFPDGQIQLGREQLRSVPCSGCGKDFLEHSTKDNTCFAEGEHLGLWAYSEIVRVQQKLSTYINVLKRGFEHPINPRYNPIIETFRTSSSGPNIQNYPRKGNFRNCVIPRDGWEFVFVDLDTVEMGTLAQVCIYLFGKSKLADAINAGIDLHLDFAANLLQISYEECLRRYKAKDPQVVEGRQFCKIANYGFAGGMGIDAFIDYARTAYDMVVPFALAERLHKAFRDHWDLHDYFAWCHSQIDDETGVCKYQVFIPSKMVRGRVPYTAVCNGYFQHLAAMIAKDALYMVQKECWAVPESPLYGTRPWLFAHDEIGAEIPTRWIGTARASAAAMRIKEIMVACARFWCPNVNIGATPAMSRRWIKGAEPVFLVIDGEKCLVAGEPYEEFDPEKGKVVEKWRPCEPMAMAA